MIGRSFIPAGAMAAWVGSHFAAAQPCNPQVSVFAGSAPDQQVGSSVAMNADATTALVGAWVDIGTTFVLVNQPGAGWVLSAQLLPGGGVGGIQNFGKSAALSADGNTALIGASGDNGYHGAAYVFTRAAGTWTQEARLVGAEGGWFGTSVSMSDDGGLAVIGASAALDHVGAAYVFARGPAGWSQQGPMLTPADGAWRGRFGTSVAISADGDTVLVGAPRDAGDIGAAHVFVRSGEAWVQLGPKITVPSTPGIARFFGRSVALSADGRTALVGAPTASANLGAAHVFLRSGAAWMQQGPMLTPSSGLGYVYFGWSVSLSADGSRALIGAVNDDAVFLFDRSQGTWHERSRMTPEPKAMGSLQHYGQAVSLNAGGTAGVVGACHGGGLTTLAIGAAYFLDVHCTLCYADCDEDSQVGLSDFACFQARFVAADPYADCNTDGTLTVQDFGCFQTKFVVGCP